MEKERLEFCMGRYDHYFDSINNKSNVLLTLEIFIVGGLVTAYPSLLEKVSCNLWLHLNMIILISAGVANLLFITWTSIPFLSKEANSLLYFGAIAQLASDEFQTRSSGASTDAQLNDLRNQVHALATGLYRKFKRLQVAGYLLLFQFAFLIPLIILIIKNLK
jgi:hypothetical protein